MKSGIYRITNLLNEKQYVGSSKDTSRRIADHKAKLRAGTHYNTQLQVDWNSYGSSAFAFEHIVDVSDIAQLRQQEQIKIDELKSHLRGYNRHPRADGPTGFKHSEETCLRRSQATKGVPRGIWSDERKKAHSIALTGRTMPPATAERGQRISAAKKGKKLSPEHVEALLQVKRDQHAKYVSENLPVWLALKAEGRSLRQIEKETGNCRRVIARELKAHE